MNRTKINGISLVIPIYNESDILNKQLKKLFIEVERKKINLVECILVENGSSDNSWEIITNLAKVYHFIVPISLPKQSYGQALKTGILRASSPTIVVFNIDLINIRFIISSLYLLQIADIVIGSKTLAASKDQRSTFRKLTTYFFNAVLRITLNYPGTDTHGIKAFRNTHLLKQTLRNCRTKNELLDTELVVRLTRSKALLVELPINVKEIRPSRYSFYRRLQLTIADFFLVMRSKYLSSSFAPKLTVADDYGISSKVNSAIVLAVKSKQAQIVSVLATHIAKKDIVELKDILPTSHWSLHFNLLRGKPISPIEQVPSLVNTKGFFFPLWIFFLRLLLKKINMAEVKLEMLAQLHILNNFGIQPKYIDSEQHIHTFIPMVYCVSEFAKSNKMVIRSYTSTCHYLYHKPFRYISLRVLQLILMLTYRSHSSFTVSYNANICHPGTNFD